MRTGSDLNYAQSPYYLDIDIKGAKFADVEF